MPYHWTAQTDALDTPAWHLSLWPHRSLPPHGFAIFIGITPRENWQKVKLEIASDLAFLQIDEQPIGSIRHGEKIFEQLVRLLPVTVALVCTPCRVCPNKTEPRPAQYTFHFPHLMGCRPLKENVGPVPLR